MRTRLRIAVTGLAATYPFGGVFWDYLQYPLGLHRLGHDVLYIEDTGKWCYDPAAATFVEDGSRNAAFLAREIAALDADLAERWFYRDATGTVYGRAWPEVARFCRSADLFLHVSASCWMREEYFAASRVVFIDSDPMYSQASVPDYLDGTIDEQARARVDMLRQHHVFFTFGENIGSSDCRIPAELFDWIPTRQPLVLDQFEKAALPVGNRRRVLTTVTSWESSEKRTVVGGVTYGGKGSEFERFIDLPARSSLPLELAITGRAPVERLSAHGWNVVDGYSLSDNPWAYRDYLASSWGEWSVAKNAYVASHSGWFSCRTACYLALGVPAIVQDTGFGTVIPVGEGIITFTDLEEAADAIDQIVHDPERHSKMARVIAEEYFDSTKVLGQLIERAFDAG
ncbi:MAG: glycosyltransferase family 1 protein [bacterium]